MSYFKHESAYVDDGAEIGAGTKIWHFSHIQKGAKIGERCVIGQNVNVDGGTVIGNNVKIQNNVSVYTGIEIEDDVFLGPSCVLTNVTNPRSQVSRHSLYERTLIRRGATIGANATIVCGVTLGRYCFIAAGSVVTKDVPDYALMVGNPARQKGWMSRHGHILRQEAGDSSKVLKCESSKVGGGESSKVLKCESSKIGETMNPSPSIVPTLELQNSRTLERPSTILVCPESGYRYELRPAAASVLERTYSLTLELPHFRTLELHCLDLDEEAPLPSELTKGTKTYDELKR
jgi:UDP-2-acetamido-3-amino-2,3-dideoxy-glucuronate N-acetyltransferase